MIPFGIGGDEPCPGGGAVDESTGDGGTDAYARRGGRIIVIVTNDCKASANLGRFISIIIIAIIATNPRSVLLLLFILILRG
jgi:hypothetical protein